MFGLGMDLSVAFIIIGLVIIIFLVSALKNLPRSSRKSLIFVVGAVAAGFGVVIFREHRLKQLQKELKEREEKLKKREEKLSQLKENYQVSERELERMRAELNKERIAYEEMMLKIKADNKAEKERIDKLSGEELHNEFIAAFEE